LGISGDGNEQTVSTFTLADIQYYYDNYMTTQGTEVVVVGDVTKEEILPKLSFLNNLLIRK
jgi:zinc protease